MEKLRQAARRQGWRVNKTKRGHWKLVPPNPTAPIVIMSSTPSCRNAENQARADLIHSGLQLKIIK